MSLPSRVRAVLASAWFDPALAVVVCTLTEIEFLDGFSHRHGSKVALAVLAFAMTSGLAWRRRAPFAFVLWAVFFEALIGFRLASIADTQTSPWLLIVVPYTAAALLAPYRALVGVALALGVNVAVGFVWSPSAVQDTFFVVAVVLISAAFGRAVRSRRDLDRTLRHATERLRAEREDRLRLAVADERSRIARELHAVVANSVSAMVVQAQAAQRLVADQDPSADAAMEAIEGAGRATLGEIRRMLGVLRDAVDPPLEPQPGVGRLQQLAERARARGRRVTLAVEGEPTALASGVEIAVYRIAEDALSAAVPGTPASILLSYRAHDVELCVEAHDAPGARWPTAVMSERVALCHGSIARDDAPGGGAELRVTLPYGFSEALEARPVPQLTASGAPSPGLMTPSS